jgi:hypothetical protein
LETPGHWQFVLGTAYEDWSSKQSFLPIEVHTSYAFFEFYKDFPEFLSGFSMGPRIVAMKNEDPNHIERCFTGWSAGIGSSTSF